MLEKYCLLIEKYQQAFYWKHYNLNIFTGILFLITNSIRNMPCNGYRDAI